MAIVSVFCAGLGKLWWNNRLMKKEEQLAAEKRARIEEMRKTGLPIKRANTVPFGVRAIQSGVEVDGIWISRPESIHELGEKLVSSSTTLGGGRDSDSQKRGQDFSEDEKSVRVTTTYLGHRQSPSAASIFQKLTDTDSIDSSNTAVPPVSQFASYTRTKRRSSRSPAGALNEDTLRRLEGRASPPARNYYDTYMPTNTVKTLSTSSPSPHHRPHNPRRPSERSSVASSSADSIDSQPRSVRSASGRSFASSQHSPKLYVAATARNPHVHAASGLPLRPWSENEGGGRGRDPFETPSPARTPNGLSQRQHQQQQHQHQEQQQHWLGDAHAEPWSGAVKDQENVPAPKPTFGPGDLHYYTRPSGRSNGGA